MSWYFKYACNFLIKQELFPPPPHQACVPGYNHTRSKQNWTSNPPLNLIPLNKLFSSGDRHLCSGGKKMFLTIRAHLCLSILCNPIMYTSLPTPPPIQVTRISLAEMLPLSRHPGQPSPLCNYVLVILCQPECTKYSNYGLSNGS